MMDSYNSHVSSVVMPTITIGNAHINSGFCEHQTVGFRQLIMVETAIKKLNALARLKENWDGFGAYPISTDAIIKSKRIVNSFLKEVCFFDVQPNPHGTISLYWKSAYGTAQLEIGKQSFSFYIDKFYDEPFFDSGEIEDINPEIGRILDEALHPENNITPPVTKVQYGSTPAF